MTVDEHRQIALGERRLTVSDCVQRDLGFTNDLLAVSPRDLGVIVDALNLLGVSPSDLVAILEALKQAGALKAEMVVI